MNTLWSGLSAGAIYVLVAVAFNVVFTVSGTFNFAQPQYLMIGTFASYATVVSLKLPVAFAVIAGAVIGYLVGVLEELLAIRPLRDGAVHGELVTTVGWAVVMQGAVLLIWGSDPRGLPGLGSSHYVSVAGGRLSLLDIALIVLALAVALLAEVWLRTTRTGIACLAIAEDSAAAMLRGINTRRVSTAAFGIAGALLGALGPIAAPKTFAIYSLGSVLVIKAFIAMSLGGFGSNAGALIGGVVVGLAEALSSRYLGGGYVNIALLVLLLVVLFLRPQGLFGQRQERVV